MTDDGEDSGRSTCSPRARAWSATSLHAATVLGRARLSARCGPTARRARSRRSSAGGSRPPAASPPRRRSTRTPRRSSTSAARSVRRARGPLQPARERALGRGRARGRRRRRDVPQPPRLRRGDRRAVQARRGRDAAQHRVRRAAADRGGQAREAARDHLRRRVRRAALGRAVTAARASSPGRTRTRSVRPTLDELIEGGDPITPLPPDREGRQTILTSGTTGTPKGASRGSPGIGAAVGASSPRSRCAGARRC